MKIKELEPNHIVRYDGCYYKVDQISMEHGLVNIRLVRLIKLTNYFDFDSSRWILFREEKLELDLEALRMQMVKSRLAAMI